LARETTAYVTRRVHASFPGAIDAIRQLSARRYRLFTASGEHSEELDGYLRAMDVRGLFGRLFGPDLVETPKEGPSYYRRIFTDAGVAPEDVLVVDDSPDAVRWAADAGATAVLVTGRANEAPEAAAVIDSLAELPGTVRNLGID
jgi:HAD superfamily hydrolase (TIGR01509 family)